nr:YkyB family protein [Anoxybacillus flavithermus]
MKQLKLKPVNVDKPDAYVKTQIGTKWVIYNLYHINNCIKVKSRVTQIRTFELTDENIAEALYIINKSAKKSRDTKQKKYYEGKYSVVNRSKTRQMKLYALKDEVISKLRSENKMEVLGYHVQGYENYLLLLKLADYTFHTPVNKLDTKGLEFLGEIDLIPAEKTKKTTLKFSEAVKLLETYIGKSINDLYKKESPYELF